MYTSWARQEIKQQQFLLIDRLSQLSSENDNLLLQLLQCEDLLIFIFVMFCFVS